MVNDETIRRLVTGAGPMYQMFLKMFSTERGVDIRKVLKYTSGLAGIACHEAAVAELQDGNNNSSDWQNAYVTGVDGRRYLFGDTLNRYLAEGSHSVLGLCIGGYHHANPEKELPDGATFYAQIAGMVAEKVGDSTYRIWDEMDPVQEYGEVRACYDGIYEHMTSKYCTKKSEEPILFGILLQNALINAMRVAPAEEVLYMALENACYLAKMEK